jgi:hypothetical protein
MSRDQTRRAGDDELTIALGLVWGYVHTGQFESAHRLARGCLEVWPGCRPLHAMAALAAIEGGWPVEQDIEAMARSIECRSFGAMILHRARGVQRPTETPARIE